MRGAAKGGLVFAVPHHVMFDNLSISLFWEEWARACRLELVAEVAAVAPLGVEELQEEQEHSSTGRGGRGPGCGEAPAEELPCQYVEFANWQRALLSSGRLESAARHWRAHLRDGDLPVLELPRDMPLPPAACVTARGVGGASCNDDPSNAGLLERLVAEGLWTSVTRHCLHTRCGLVQHTRYS